MTMLLLEPLIRLLLGVPRKRGRPWPKSLGPKPKVPVVYAQPYFRVLPPIPRGQAFP